jgi:UDPglucose 6-dehydrogenase
MNEIAALRERIGTNVEHVRHGIGSDSRIGNSFLFPGTGFGGSCFPKDLAPGEGLGLDLRTVRATLDVNRLQKRVLLQKV